MAKRSATDTIKSLNGENKSGAIKQALDLIKQLENSKAGQTNPEAMQAMGAGNVSGMLKALMQMMKGGGGGGGSQQQNQEDENKRLQELEELQRRIEEIDQELQENLPQTPPVGNTQPTTPSIISFSRTARYIKWTINQSRGANIVQVAELILLSNGSPVAWPIGTSVTNPSGNNPGGEEPNMLVDGNTATKWVDLNFQSINNNTATIIIDTGNSVTFNSYLYVTGNDLPARDPTGWLLETSNNGIIWKVADGRLSANITNERNANTQIFVGSE